MDPVTLAFLIGGIALLASEAFAPSMVAGFFGAAALITAGLRGIGLVDTIPVSLLLWGITSIALVIPIRPMLKRIAGKADVNNDATDVEQDRDAMGAHVVIVEDVHEENDAGRIRFQGTTWQARSTTGTLLAGQKAQLVYREGSIWVVEPVVAENADRDVFGLDAAAVVDREAAQIEREAAQLAEAIKKR